MYLFCPTEENKTLQELELADSVPRRTLAKGNSTSSQCDRGESQRNCQLPGMGRIDGQKNDSSVEQVWISWLMGSSRSRKKAVMDKGRLDSFGKMVKRTPQHKLSATKPEISNGKTSISRGRTNSSHTKKKSGAGKDSGADLQKPKIQSLKQQKREIWQLSSYGQRKMRSPYSIQMSQDAVVKVLSAMVMVQLVNKNLSLKEKEKEDFFYIMGVWQEETRFEYSLKVGNYNTKSYLHFMDWQAQQAMKRLFETGKLTVIIHDNASILKCQVSSKTSSYLVKTRIECIFSSSLFS